MIKNEILHIKVIFKIYLKTKSVKNILSFQINFCFTNIKD